MNGHAPETETDVRSSEEAAYTAALGDAKGAGEAPCDQAQPDQFMNGHAPVNGLDVRSSNPVFAGDLGDERTNPKNGEIKVDPPSASTEATSKQGSREAADEPIRAPIWSPNPWMGDEGDLSAFESASE